MVAAIIKELSLQRDYLHNEEVNTLYFGGGTPSLLDNEDLAAILHQVYDLYNVTPGAEVTLEANPDDLSYSKLKELKESPVNRLSIGVQTFDEEVLKLLNRAHTRLQGEECLALARQLGFENISLDLIYGIPGRGEAQWVEDLERALHHRPGHISTYSLTIEPKTVFGRRQARGKFPAIDEEQAAHQFELMLDILGKAGYEQYEISNFCLPGYYSRHNSSYWKQQEYLGIGPSAHSYDGKSRQFNISNNGKYMKSIAAGVVPYEREVLEKKDKVNEYLLTTLRTKWGTDLARLKDEFNVNLLKDRAPYIRDLLDSKLAKITNQHLGLTNKGKLLADKISSDLFID